MYGGRAATAFILRTVDGCEEGTSPSDIVSVGDEGVTNIGEGKTRTETLRAW